MRRFFFLCPDENSPYGGIKIIYRHVEALNDLGFKAFVYHETPGFKINWFPSKAPVAYPTQGWLRSTPPFTPDDILVLPEFNLSQTYPRFRHMPYLVFNQNVYGTFNFKPVPKAPFASYPPLKEYLDAKGIICVSEDNHAILQALYPSIPCHRLILSLDNFHYSPHKEKIIAFSPAREIKQALILFSLLNLHDWTFVPLINLSEAKVHETFQKTVLYLNFTHPEGFGLPGAEALKCGALVVGYDGRASLEYLKPPYATVIPMGDILAFRDETLKAISLFEKDRDTYNRITKQGSDALSRYNDEAERASLKAAYAPYV